VIYIRIHLLAEVGAPALFLQHALHVMKLTIEAFHMFPVIGIGNCFVRFWPLNFLAEG
jgi:hypothetical protein